MYVFVRCCSLSRHTLICFENVARSHATRSFSKKINYNLCTLVWASLGPFLVVLGRLLGVSLTAGNPQHAWIAAENPYLHWLGLFFSPCSAAVRAQHMEFIPKTIKKHPKMLKNVSWNRLVFVIKKVRILVPFWDLKWHQKSLKNVAQDFGISLNTPCQILRLGVWHGHWFSDSGSTVSVWSIYLWARWGRANKMFSSG